MRFLEAAGRIDFTKRKNGAESDGSGGTEQRKCRSRSQPRTQLVSGWFSVPLGHQENSRGFPVSPPGEEAAEEKKRINESRGGRAVEAGWSESAEGEVTGLRGRNTRIGPGHSATRTRPENLHRPDGDL